MDNINAAFVDAAESKHFSRRAFLKGGSSLLGGLMLAACGAAEPRSVETKMPETDPSSGEFSQTPLWSQDFSQSSDGLVDNNIWHHELNPEVPGYNDEAQGYTDSPRNVRVEDGVLVIEAHREPYEYRDDPERKKYEITSGRIDTRNSLTFEYGKLEATMKMPEGSGTWPAFWLLSANQTHTADLKPSEEDWAKPRFYMHDGELDIMEYYGDKPGMIEGTLHTYSGSTETQVEVPDAATTFHTYGIELSPERVVWTLDGKPYKTFEKPSDNPEDWPFSQGNKFYAILNLAMSAAGGEINPDVETWRMDIKSINYYDYLG